MSSVTRTAAAFCSQLPVPRHNRSPIAKHLLRVETNLENIGTGDAVTAFQTAMSALTQNDSRVEDVQDNEDMELFNLSRLSDNDLLPDQLSHQVRLNSSSS